MGAKIQIVICIGLTMDLRNLKPTLVKKNIARKLLIMCSHMQVFFVYDAEIICKTASLYVCGFLFWAYKQSYNAIFKCNVAYVTVGLNCIFLYF